MFPISDTVSLKSKITDKKKVPKGQIHKKQKQLDAQESKIQQK